MAIIIESRQDDGSWIPAVTLTEKILEVEPDTKVRMVKGNVSGVEVPDQVAVKYLMTLYTAAGNKRKEKADG